jgi:hypothetical protein
MPKAEATGLAPLLIGTSRTLEHLCSGVFDFDGAISGWWSFRAEALGLENAKAAGRILPGARSSDLNTSHRRGDNLYTCSIIALDPATGTLKWHYQEVPQDVWDYDAAFELILADIPLNGQTRKVLMQPTKTGYVWMLDRVTGELLKTWRFAKHVNWITGITENGKLVGRLEPEVGKTKLNANISTKILDTWLSPSWEYIPLTDQAR